MEKEEALKILLQNVKHREELFMPENKWILHSLGVGKAAERIASAIGVNSQKALVYGYLHDIGRMINHSNHPIEGYKYLMNLGFENEARICLTHSFIDNDINKTAGGGPKDIDSYNFINNYLQNNPHNIYDNIIQLCDLLCVGNEYTTIEKRLLDIYTRREIYDNSYDHYKSALELKSRIDKALNYDLYSLFLINLKNLENDTNKLNDLFKNNKKYILNKKNI